MEGRGTRGGRDRPQHRRSTNGLQPGVEDGEEGVGRLGMRQHAVEDRADDAYAQDVAQVAGGRADAARAPC